VVLIKIPFAFYCVTLQWANSSTVVFLTPL
jgi:hypothetical protein